MKTSEPDKDPYNILDVLMAIGWIDVPQGLDQMTKETLRATLLSALFRLRENKRVLEDVYTFIADEYSDPKAQALEGELLSKEAREVFSKVCTALRQYK